MSEFPSPLKAKITGDLKPEDFDVLKQNIAEETEKIEAELSVLEQERTMLQELSQQPKREKVNMLATWRTAGIQGKLELQKAMFSDGLVWSHESGYLNRKNKLLVESLQALCQELSDPKEAAERLIVKFGVPGGI